MITTKYSGIFARIIDGTVVRGFKPDQDFTPVGYVSNDVEQLCVFSALNSLVYLTPNQKIIIHDISCNTSKDITSIVRGNINIFHCRDTIVKINTDSTSLFIQTSRSFTIIDFITLEKYSSESYTFESDIVLSESTYYYSLIYTKDGYLHPFGTIPVNIYNLTVKPIHFYVPIEQIICKTSYALIKTMDGIVYGMGKGHRTMDSSIFNKVFNHAEHLRVKHLIASDDQIIYICTDFSVYYVNMTSNNISWVTGLYPEFLGLGSRAYIFEYNKFVIQKLDGQWLFYEWNNSCQPVKNTIDPMMEENVESIYGCNGAIYIITFDGSVYKTSINNNTLEEPLKIVRYFKNNPVMTRKPWAMIKSAASIF